MTTSQAAEWTSASPIFLPRSPEPAPPRAFPIIATVAPVIGSIALWLITKSPYVLVFALLGPIVAMASLGDASLHGRRRLRRELASFEADAEAVSAAISRAHDEEIAFLAAAHPTLRRLESRGSRDPSRFATRPSAAVAVTVGIGRVQSQLALEGARRDSPPAASDRSDRFDRFNREIDRLRADAAVLHEAPVVIDANAGIGICGPETLATASARGIVLQLAHTLSPVDFELLAPAEERWSWLRVLPHAAAASVKDAASGRIEFRPRERSQATGGFVVAVAATAEALPTQCHTILAIGAGFASLLVQQAEPRSQGDGRGTIAPEFVSEEQARAFAQALGLAAASAGLGGAGHELPEQVSLSFTGSTVLCGRERDSLACTPVSDANGPVSLDLVRDGPHALVGGTTGSGKSELLVSWVLSMAESHAPDAVNFLLVDFKGGSSFAGVQDLPHAVGLITDLDERSALRALTSLRAELRYRERTIADAGVRSIEQLQARQPLPRLVIVVDEFAAMVQDFPELHELFADIASRGRSLGVHLILCTQRPAGVVRDAIAANCTLRVSLRVNNRADSTAVIGSAAAAELPRHPLGRAFVSRTDGAPQLVQVALATQQDSERIAASWPGGSGQQRAPWCDPLPGRVPLEQIEQPTSGLAFGLEDAPEEQRQHPAVYDPERHGSLLVIGGHRSGKSGVLGVIATAGDPSVRFVPESIDDAWDVVSDQLSQVRRDDAHPGGRLILIDDLDTLLGRFSDDYAQAFTEMLVQLLREGGRSSTHLVLTVRRLTASVQAIAALCDSRLVLRLPNRQEHLLAGGSADAFDPELAPGGAHWGDHRVQVAVVAAISAPVRPRLEPLRLADSPCWLVVSERPAELARTLREHPVPTSAGQSAAALVEMAVEVVELAGIGSPTAGELVVVTPGAVRLVVADAETWQSHWGLMGILKARHPVIFDGCSLADFRVLSRLRVLPPPISPSTGCVWLLRPDGTLSRAMPSWRVNRVA